MRLGSALFGFGKECVQLHSLVLDARRPKLCFALVRTKPKLKALFENLVARFAGKTFAQTFCHQPNCQNFTPSIHSNPLEPIDENSLELKKISMEERKTTFGGGKPQTLGSKIRALLSKFSPSLCRGNTKAKARDPRSLIHRIAKAAYVTNTKALEEDLGQNNGKVETTSLI